MLNALPPLLLGMATAIVMETGVGLLLFVSPGLLPALTVILVVGLAALALGLASRPGAVPAAGRWHWLLAVGSLVLAAVLSLGWTFQGGAPEDALGRGLNLALLVGLPLYSLGACLAGVATWGRSRRTGALATGGGALGALILGSILFPRFEPMSVYLFALLCVATAALAVSWSLDVPAPESRAGGENDPWSLDPPAE